MVRLFFSAVLALLALPAAAQTIPPTNPTALVGAASGGLSRTSFVSAGSNNATILKALPGQVYAAHCGTIAAGAIQYLKFYDKATTPAPATDTPVYVLQIAGAGAASAPLSPSVGISFTTGISYALVLGIAANDNTSVTAANAVCSIAYR